MSLKCLPIKESYYLSNFNSKLLENGSLEITLTINNVVNHIKITSWKEGIKVFGYCSKDKKQKYEPIKPPPINLITVPHQNNKLPVYHYLKDIPEGIKLLVGAHLTNQLIYLQICSNVIKASDLIKSNPILLFLWFHQFIFKKKIDTWERADFYLAKKQKTILSLIVHQNCTDSDVKILKKIKLNKGNEEELDLINWAFVKYYKKVRDLKHYKIIPVELFLIVELEVKISKIPVLINSVNAMNIENSIERNALSNRISIIRDIFNMTFGDLSSRLRQCKTDKQLDTLHELIRINFDPVSNLPLDTQFDEQPVPDYEDHIEAITNQKQLLEEGETMNHCVAYYGSKIYENSDSYIYRVLKPERATLLIVYDYYEHCYKIEECKLKFNHEPGPETYNFIQNWLDEEKNKLRKPNKTNY